MRIPARVTTYAVGTTLALTGTLAATTAVAPTASADQNQASAAADWLAGELGSNGLLPGQFGGGDVGVSIDAGFSLAAIGGHDLDVTRIANAVSGPDGENYVQYSYSYDSDSDGTNEQYVGQAANATAKALAFLASLPAKRGTAGTVDLRQRMEALTANAGATRGRIADVSTKDGTPDGQDYANTLGQAFAARGLAEAGSAEAPAALSFLLQQQCPTGGFRLSFSAPSAAQGCTDSSTSAVDATAIAVAEIEQLPVTDATTKALYRARAWLRGQQRADGSFDGGAGTAGSNSNTTGLAAIALGTGDAAKAASTWVARRQVPADQTGPLATDKGAIAYDDAAKDAAAANGIEDSARDQFDRATAQAAGALLVVNPANRALGLTGPSGYQRAGSTITLNGSGLMSGRTAQLSGPGLSKYRTSSSSTWQNRVTLPAGSATRRYVLGEDTGLSAARSIKVLGSKKLAVAVSRYRVRRSHYVTATVSGLASGEKATISYRGSRVRSGVASTSGKFKATFRVRRSLGRKAVVGVGQFTDIRRGTGYVRVVR